jgi:predicted small lipoprotein YifL
MKTILRLAVFAMIVSPLAACGLRGDLEPAPPLYGRAKAEYDAAVAKAEADRVAAEAAKAKAAKPARP